MPLGLGNIDLKIRDQSYNVEIQFRYAVLSFVFLGLVEEVLSQICWVFTTSKRVRTGKDHHFLLPLGDLWPSPFWFPNRRHVLPDGARLHTPRMLKESILLSESLKAAWLPQELSEFFIFANCQLLRKYIVTNTNWSGSLGSAIVQVVLSIFAGVLIPLSLSRLWI